jgi:hypothetical protein
MIWTLVIGRHTTTQGLLLSQEGVELAFIGDKPLTRLFYKSILL